MSNNITIITKETITMVTQIIIIMITITTTNSMTTLSEKEMTLIEIMNKITIKGITNNNQMRKKKEKSKIDMTESETRNQITKIKMTIKTGNDYRNKFSQKEK